MSVLEIYLISSDLRKKKTDEYQTKNESTLAKLQNHQHKTDAFYLSVWHTDPAGDNGQTNTC